MRDDGGKLQAVHKAGGRFPAALDAEGNDAAGAVRHIFHSELVVRAALKTRIVDPRHAVVLLEEFGNLLRIRAMALHAQRERFHAEVEVKCVHRGSLRANVTHQVAARFCDIRRLTEVLGIHDAVIRFIRLCELRELAVVPIEITAVYNGAAELHRVTVEVLCGGVRDDVYAELERTAVDRRRERVIDDARYAVRVCGVCKHFEVCHDERRVRKRFRKHAAGVLTECGVQLVLGAVRRNECAVDAHFMQGFVEQVECAAVYGAGAHNMTSCVADVQNGHHGGCLAGRCDERAYAALECRKLLFHSVERRVAEARIEKAVRF